MTAKPRVTTPAVTRATAVLDYLANSSQPRRLSDIAAALDRPLSSTASICNALEDERLVDRGSDGYRLGTRVVELAHSYLANIDVLDSFADVVAAADVLRHETVQLAMLDGDEVIYLARRDGDRPFQISSNVGKRLPASCTAVGKAILAALEPHLRPIPDPLPRLTEHSITSRRKLDTELAATAARGYAIDDEETSIGVTCVAVPVNTSGPGPRYAVSVTILKARHDADLEQQLISNLRAAAATLWPGG